LISQVGIDAELIVFRIPAHITDAAAE
jgi:hypothetical protein